MPTLLGNRLSVLLFGDCVERNSSRRPVGSRSRGSARVALHLRGSVSRPASMFRHRPLGLARIMQVDSRARRFSAGNASVVDGVGL